MARQGTSIYMAINLDTPRTLDSVLRAHSLDGDGYGFERTVVPLQLLMGQGTGLESRAQAKRVAARLQQFRHAEVDFTGIADVAVAPNGDIYIVDGYGSQIVSRFDKNFKHLKTIGGRTKGKGPEAEHGDVEQSRERARNRGEDEQHQRDEPVDDGPGLLPLHGDGSNVMAMLASVPVCKRSTDAKAGARLLALAEPHSFSNGSPGIDGFTWPTRAGTIAAKGVAVAGQAQGHGLHQRRGGAHVHRLAVAHAAHRVQAEALGLGLQQPGPLQLLAHGLGPPAAGAGGLQGQAQHLVGMARQGTLDPPGVRHVLAAGGVDDHLAEAVLADGLDLPGILDAAGQGVQIGLLGPGKAGAGHVHAHAQRVHGDDLEHPAPFALTG